MILRHYGVHSDLMCNENSDKIPRAQMRVRVTRLAITFNNRSLIGDEN